MASSNSSGDSPIDVATAHEADIIQQIEQGEYVEGQQDAQASVDDDTHSLTDSIRQHIVDGGRRYHAYHAGMYAFPNDELEQQRDNMKHDLTIHLCKGKHFFAPVAPALERGVNVLDLGMYAKSLAW